MIAGAQVQEVGELVRADQADFAVGSLLETHPRLADIHVVPVKAIMVVPVFWLSTGAQALTLDMNTLAGIFSGDITHWNDARIAVTNLLP